MERGVRLRLICMAPDPAYAVPGRRRVIILTKPRGLIVRLDRAEYVLPEDEVQPYFAAVLAAGAHATVASALGGLAAYQVAEQGVRDLLVCTHGSRGIVCGEFGYPIYTKLRTEYAERSEGRLRVWRASHFGGHRFAPTILDCPEGRCWAHVKPEILDALVWCQGEVKPAHALPRLDRRTVPMVRSLSGRSGSGRAGPGWTGTRAAPPTRWIKRRNGTR